GWLSHHLPRCVPPRRCGRFCLTQAASVDCLLHLINRGLRRQGISGRSNRHAVSAVPNERFERGAIVFPNLTAPPILLALKRTDFKASIDFDFVHFVLVSARLPSA